MGGPGSGRSEFDSKKLTVEQCTCLDARQLKLKAGLEYSGELAWQHRYTKETICSCEISLDTLNPQSAWIQLSYGFQDTGEHFCYDIDLENMAQPFGGLRWYFSCPTEDRDGQLCGRRVSKLYLPPGGKVFGCRYCHDLTYTSCQTSHMDCDQFYAEIADKVGATPKEVKRIWKALQR